MKFLVQEQPAFVYTGARPFDPAKPSAVFIHGAANDHSVWQLQARYLAHHGWNALAVDLPGHGRSFGRPRENIAAYVDWVIDLLDQGAITSAALIGHSMGSLIALEAALRYPVRVSHLCLIGTSLPMLVSDVLLEAAKHAPDEAFNMLTLWGHAPATQLGRSPIPGTWLPGSYRRLLQHTQRGTIDVLPADLGACHAYTVDEARLAQLAVPTHVVAGTRDMMTPAKAGRALAQKIAGAKFILLEGAGHAMMQEAPALVTDALKTLLSR